MNTLEQELAEKAAKIKTTENVVEKGCNKFLAVVLGKKWHSHWESGSKMDNTLGPQRL